MTQKELTEALVDKLLQTIDPLEIADESLRQTIEILLNLVEQLNSQVKNLTEENQRLRDENNRLKGEQGVWVSLIEWYSSVRTLEYHSSHLC